MDMNTVWQLVGVGFFLAAWFSVTVGLILVVKKILRISESATRRRDRKIREAFGSSKVYKDGRLPENLQRQLNGLLQQPSSYIGVGETIAAKNWTYFDVGWVTVLACKHREVSPYIIVRRDTAKGNLSRLWVDRMTDDSLVYCEGIVDKDFDIYCHAQDEIDTLAILSPEVLDELRRAPHSASIVLKRDVAYYVLAGSHDPLTSLEKLLTHAQHFIPELEENLGRFARSRANKDKIAQIKAQLVGQTDLEMGNDPSRGYFTKY